MRSLIATFSIMFLVHLAQAEDGLFFGLLAKGREMIENGELVNHLPLQRLPVTAAVLRPDTDNKALFWLEFHLPERRDPGDFVYCLVADGKLIRAQMVVRPSELNAKGCKWAMEIKEAKAGEAIQKAITQAYGLDPKIPPKNPRQNAELLSEVSESPDKKAFAMWRDLDLDPKSQPVRIIVLADAATGNITFTRYTHQRGTGAVWNPNSNRCIVWDAPTNAGPTCWLFTVDSRRHWKKTEFDPFKQLDEAYLKTGDDHPLRDGFDNLHWLDDHTVEFRIYHRMGQYRAVLDTSKALNRPRLTAIPEKP